MIFLGGSGTTAFDSKRTCFMKLYKKIICTPLDMRQEIYYTVHR